jgi:hypothetical protein
MIQRRTRPAPAPAEPPQRVGRIQELLNRRRSTVIETRAARIETQRTTGGAVAVLPKDAGLILTDILSRANYEPRPARGTEYLHVSDLLTKCIRRFAIIEQNKIAPPPQRLSLMDLLTFGVGEKIHDVVKDRAAVGGPSMIWGNWSCGCKKMHSESPRTFAELDDTAACTACGGGYSLYHEVPMHDEELKIVGTPDLLVYLREFDAFFITELKSIAHDTWKELIRPVPDHVIQVMFYWYLMKKLGYRVASQVSIMYVTKGYVWGGNVTTITKEFMIEPEPMIARLDPYLEEAAAFKASRENGGLPPRLKCVSDISPDAKKCDVCSICFGNSNAPQKISIASALRTPRRAR